VILTSKGVVIMASGTFATITIVTESDNNIHGNGKLKGYRINVIFKDFADKIDQQKLNTQVILE